MIANGEEKISRKGAKAQRSSLSNQCLFFFSVPLCVCVRSFLLLLLVQGFLVSANSTAAADRPLVLVVVGAEGDKEFAEPFRQWAGRWEEAAKAAPADFFAIGLEEPGEVSDRDLLKSQIEKAAGPSAEAFWLVLIGHGTYDGKLARFNLRGADISPTELVGWLKPVERPLAVICQLASRARPMSIVARPLPDGNVLLLPLTVTVT